MTDNSKKITEELRISKEKRIEIERKVKSISDFKGEIEELSNKGVSEFLEIVLGGAILLDVSDIHIEPEEKQSKIRARIDGILEDMTTINQEVYNNLLSRIKLLSGIKLNISDRPQDGRFSFFMPENQTVVSVELRVSTLPAEYGEAIVIRILNPKSLIDLDELGLREDLLNLFKKEIKKPNGMIIITGPTGSGKTTTLYAFLKKIQNPGIKIVTIEDPIEYHLKGVSQTQVNPGKGYDFASGLQSIMRQDPDVILVGEIRDSKTCQIALQAALTGHLVFTTLHTNDAAGTIARLTSLEGDLVNIGPAVNLVIAQRLVRKVCEKCREFKPASRQVLIKLEQELKKISKKVKTPKINKETDTPQVKGCKYCNFTGYRGRIGIFEAILIGDEMEKFILKNPSIAAFREEAIKAGMITMYQDGLIKILKGITTIEELERIAGTEE